MISLALGLVIVGATTALLLSTRASYAAQDEILRVQDAGAYALESITRAVRQTAYVDWREGDAPVVPAAASEPSIVGYDSRRITGGQTNTSGIDSPLSDSIVNGSDVLAVRFSGSGSGTNGDGTIVDCAGTGIPAPTSGVSTDERGMSIFYVAKSSSGEPELYCRWHGESKWSSQPIVRGVESFQVLYGLDTDGDSLPNKFVNAAAIDALDDSLVLQGTNAVERGADKQRKTYWKKVVAVRVALLVRGSLSARNDSMTNVYDLFGKDYGDAYATSDPGTRVNEASMTSSTRNRIRKVFSSTILLRNPVSSGDV